MKNWINSLALLLMVSGLLFLVSCGDDTEDVDVPLTPLIVGDWQYEAVDISITINGKDIFDFFKEEYELSDEEAQDLADSFEESMNNFEGMSWSFTENGNYVLTNTEGNESGKWALNGDKTILTLTSGNDSDEINVNVLTSNKLKLTYNHTHLEDMDEDGIDEEFGISISLSLKK